MFGLGAGWPVRPLWSATCPEDCRGGGLVPNSTPVCPLGHRGAHRVRRDGSVATKQGRRQLFVCVAPDGTSHSFRGLPPG